MDKRTLKGVPNKKKIEILDRIKNRQGKSLQNIAKEFNIPANTLSTIAKNESKIRAQPEGDKRMKNRPLKHAALEEALYKWIVQCRSTDINLSGPIITAKAKTFAETMKIVDFKASNGWLRNFKNRHGISFKKICGESKSVDTGICDDWKENLVDLTAGYALDDIVNADETGK